MPITGLSSKCGICIFKCCLPYFSWTEMFIWLILNEQYFELSKSSICMSRKCFVKRGNMECPYTKYFLHFICKVYIREVYMA